MHAFEVKAKSMKSNQVTFYFLQPKVYIDWLNYISGGLEILMILLTLFNLADLITSCTVQALTSRFFPNCLLYNLGKKGPQQMVFCYQNCSDLL